MTDQERQIQQLKIELSIERQKMARLLKMMSDMNDALQILSCRARAVDNWLKENVRVE